MQQEQGRAASQMREAQENRIACGNEKPDTPAGKRGEGFYFAGFKSPNYTPIPDEFFDLLAPNLSEAELRVLLYIMRRTFGFKKQADAISLSQLTGGIRKRNGEVQDSGTGLSKPAALKGVAGLQEKGIIVVEKRMGEDGRNEINVYRLRYAEEQVVKVSPPPVSQANAYSTIEYSSNKIETYPPPDLRSDNLPPLTLAAGQRRRQVGVNSSKLTPLNKLPEKSDTENNGRVNDVNYQGKAYLLPEQPDLGSSKADLPMPSPDLKVSKGNLPGRVSEVNRGGKAARPETVKELYPQHGSLQKNSYQKTVINKMARRTENGNLAIKPQVDVVVDITENDLKAGELEQLLLGYGLSQKSVEELLQKWPEDHIRAKIRLVEELSRTQPQAVRNLPGFIRQAIIEDYQPVKRPATLKNQAGQSGSRYRKAARPGALNFTDRKYGSSLRQEPEPTGSLRRNTWIEVTEEKPHPTSQEDSQSRSNYPIQEAKAWERVCEALAGRYRRADLVEKLAGSRLCFDVANERVNLKLGQPWMVSSLLYAERALMQMVISQEVGPGYSLEISVD